MIWKTEGGDAAMPGRMEESGLIGRVPHERDGRASRVRLKAAGRAVLEKALPVSLAFQEGILAALAPGRRSGFLEDLALIADACARCANGKWQMANGQGSR